MSRLSVQRFILLAIAAIAVPACGGGSSGGGAPAILGVVEFASPTANIVEGAAASISLAVNRTGGNQAVTVAWATSNGTATGSEYTGGSGTLSWAAGDTAPQNIDIPISALDATLEAPATFIVTLSAPTGAALGPVLATTVTVTDGDSAGVIQFSPTAYSVNEGAGTVTLTITRTGGTVAGSAVVSTADVSATAGADYTALTAFPVSFAANATSATVDVTVAAGGDGFEASETFTATITPGAGTLPGTDLAATVTIDNIDLPPNTPGDVGFTAATASGAEGAPGAPGTVTLNVQRVGGVGPVTVNYASVNGVAQSPADFTAVTGTLSWADGDFANKQIVISISDFDTLIEGEEIFTVVLSNPTNANLLTSVSTVTIGDADAPAEGVFQFSQLTYAITEGTAANVDLTVTVRRTSGTTGAATVDCVIAAVAPTDASDFTVVTPQTLSWADGEAGDKTFTISILNDGLDAQGVETISLTLTNATPNGGPEISVSQGAATVEITDADQNGELEFSSIAYSALENSGQATITVRRLGGASGAVSVGVTLAGGVPPAVAGTHYTDPSPVVLNWAAGDAADKTFTIDLTDNATADPSVALTLTLTGATGGASISPINGVATLTIQDDDAGFFAFSAPTYSESEANPTLTITVSRQVGSVGAATVEVLVANGTADGSDYTVAANPVLLSFADGETTKTFDITITSDITFEPDETITLTLQNPVNAALGTPITATATLVNDDSPPGGLFVFESPTYNVNEDDLVVTVRILRNGTNTLPVTVTIKTANGSAKGNGGRRDYDSQNNVVINFAAGVTFVDVDIDIIDDTRVEGPETFRVQLLNPTNQSGLGTPSVTTVTIASED